VEAIALRVARLRGVGSCSGPLGVLLIVASVAYLFDSFACFLSSSHGNHEAHSLVFAIPAIISELSLTVWLLIWGG
jgi:hypothetical protein